jgi:hypothetical protein
MGKRELAAEAAALSGGDGFECLGLARARTGEIGKRRTRSASQSVIWLSVKYAWHIMRNMRHAYLILSQITQP